MQGIVDTESLEIVPSKYVVEYFSGVHPFSTNNNFQGYTFNKDYAGFENLNDLPSPDLISVGLYVLADRTESIEKAGYYLNQTMARFYPNGGYYQSDPKKEYRAIVVSQAKTLLTGVDLSGKYVRFKFTFLCDGNQTT